MPCVGVTSAAVAEANREQPVVEKISKPEVLAKWREFQKSVEQWETNKTPVLVNWDGGLARSFEQIEPSVVDLMGYFQDGSVFSRDAWQTVLAIDTFIQATVTWAETVKQQPKHTDPAGGKDVWDAFSAVEQAANDNLPDRIESVASLLSLRGITPQHIAIIYDWYDAAGNPDIDQVEDERLNPGKHTSSLRNPAKLKREKDVEAAWKARSEQFGGYDPSVFDGPRESIDISNEPPAPESIEELLSLDGMTLEQVAKMKKITIDEVRESAKQIAYANESVARMVGNELAAERLAVDPAAAMRRRIIEAAVVETYPELTVEERVWAMADDGHHVGRILAGLRAQGSSIRYEDVLRYLSRKPVNDGREEASPEETESGLPQEERPAVGSDKKKRGRAAGKATAST